ncbi:TRAP transporter small permease [Thermodesulfobacteriota bacterium]
MKAIRAVIGRLNDIEDWFVGILLLTMIVVAFSQIVLRNLAGTSMSWSDPVLRNLVLWVGLFGASLATRDRNHITIDILSQLLSERARSVARIFTGLFTAAVCAFLAFASFKFVHSEAATGNVLVPHLPVWVAQSVMPLAFGLMGLRSAGYVVLDLLAAIRGGDDGQGV